MVAWFEAESEPNKTTTFDERVELCNYAEWCARRALGLAAETYEGIPHIGIDMAGPSAHLFRCNRDEAKSLADRVLEGIGIGATQ